MSSACISSFLRRFKKRNFQATRFETRRDSFSSERETSISSSTDTPPAASFSEQQNSFRFCFASETDIGGGKKNEDDQFIWKHQSSNSVVLGVIDGHGGNQGFGKFAAQQSRIAMVDWLELNFLTMFENPSLALKKLFISTHDVLFSKLRDHLLSRGYEVTVKEGYLLYKNGKKSSWKTANGGAVCSVVVLLQGGSKMYTANLGDCSAILSINGKVLSSSMLKPLYPENDNEELKFNSDELECPDSKVLRITWDHSPECPREFRWLREKRACEGNAFQPFLRCVYEGLPSNGREYNDIFEVDEKGNLAFTGSGLYHKNVRGEWATRVLTPPDSKMQEALSTTRSFGDFPLQSCGVSHVPDVFEVNLKQCFESGEVGVIVLCTDGVWDNWYFEEVAEFFLQDSLVTIVAESESADFPLKQFMQANHGIAKQIFGSKADNATGIVCYLFKSSIC